MSVAFQTDECFPGVADRYLAVMIGREVPPRESRHELCPGGHHTPGVIGGWHCPCDCHATTDAAGSA